jgi:PBSX family phage terminase large subunit
MTALAPNPRRLASDPTRHYRAYGAALDLWKCRDPEVLISGPAGTGKSLACLNKLHAAALRWPGMRGLIVRKTRESMTESVLVTFERDVIPEGSPLARGANRATRKSYRYPGGSEIIVGGLQQAGRDAKQKIMSTEYDMIYVQEAIELQEHDWENLTTRLRNGVMPFQQLIADTNPDAPGHWLKRRCDAGRCVLLESRHEDNPLFYDHAAGAWTTVGDRYITGTLDALTGVRKPRLRYGRWVAAEGAVYEEFDRDIHVIDRFPIPAEWRRVRAMDFGYTNPYVCIWGAIDPDGRLYIYREVYMTGRTVRVHTAQVKRLSEGERIEATVADHDAEDRATLAENGILTIPAWKAIGPGIQAVQERLVPAGDGKPRLFLMRDSLVERDESLADAKKPYCTEQEFDNYIWPKGQDGRAVKEVPVDDSNHSMDALRYLVAYADGLGRKVVRFH